MSIQVFAGDAVPPRCPERTCKVYYEDRLADAMSRVDNRQFFFGLTSLGYQKHFREAVNPACRDHYSGSPELTEFLPTAMKVSANGDIDYGQLAEKFHPIDLYSGLVDGRNYGRVNRLRQQKMRHARNPNGTEKRFCVPMTDSMSYGWFARDMKQLDETKWYAVRERFPQVRGEITKFVDEMALHSPSFRLF